MKVWVLKISEELVVYEAFASKEEAEACLTNWKQQNDTRDALWSLEEVDGVECKNVY